MRIALLLLLLAAPALAEDPAPEAPPPLDEAELAELFGPVKSKRAASDHMGAGNVLMAILEDETKASAHGRAWGDLAGVLEDLDLDLAAVSAWRRSFDTDSSHIASLGHAVELATATGDEEHLAPAMAAQLKYAPDANARSAAAYIAARRSLRNDELGPAIEHLKRVDKAAPIYADAEALRGVVLSNQGLYQQAIAPLITAQALGREQERGPRFDNRMILNIARAYYGAENWGQSIYAFSQVERTSEYWPEAQFERAWAHFRAEDMTGALSLLMNHGAPFFEQWHFPEADLLRGYALFMMCKFPDASKEMDAFAEKYTPIRASLAEAAGSMDAAGAFADARGLREGGTSQLPPSVLRPFLYEDRFAESMRLVDEAQRELERARSLEGALGTWVAASMAERRTDRIEVEGERVLGRVTAARSELDEMLQGIDITRLDLLNLETQMYERAAATGVLDYGDRIGKLRDLKKRKRGYRVWPFDGEYWADELGWFHIDARPDCPENMATGER